MPVVGIGGIFFRARNPDALRAWYHTHLGIPLGYEPWQQAAGPTMIMPFPADTEYFPAAVSAMINFRVENLEGLLTDLRNAGVAVQTDPAWNTPETGDFARIHDPEGNPIELWQPPAD